VIVGVPTETKRNETRVAITPAGVHELRAHGHTGVIQSGAGLGSTIPDDEFAAAGAEIAPDADAVFAHAEMICKVKEPQPPELAMLRAGQILFTYLHIAAYPDIGTALVASGVTAVGYETVALVDGRLPLLAPMSEVAGRMAVQVGAHFLERAAGGRGLLLGGVTGVRPANVVVIGAGVAGKNAAHIASGMCANVTILDIDADKLRYLDELLLGRVTTIASSRFAIHEYVANADLVIGSVLVPGARAPHLVDEDTVRAMRQGSVVVDIAIDQGGCVETSRETSHDDPTFVTHGVVHYAVGNIPAAVPHTSTYALTNATLPYVVGVADHGVVGATNRLPSLAPGVQIAGGHVTNPAVAEVLGSDAVPIADVLGA
jgi:alanine dehydrogenase